jgi:hypothetical protein
MQLELHVAVAGRPRGMYHFAAFLQACHGRLPTALLPCPNHLVACSQRCTYLAAGLSLHQVQCFECLESTAFDGIGSGVSQTE